MTRKRIRYSELAKPAAPEAEKAPSPVAESEPANDAISDAPSETIAIEATTEGPAISEPLIVEAAPEPFIVERDDEAPLIAAVEDRPAPVAPRPRRNSTPVELARTLTAERAAARAQQGGAEPVEEAHIVTRPAPVNEPPRTLRELARARSGAAELLMFRVGGERFAVQLIAVDEVIDLPVIHHVPEMPPAMLGVVTVRGSLTPVYSPEHALGLPLAHRDALLIFRRGAHRVGILIDDVDDALIVDMSELREKPSGEEGDNVLLGVIRLATSLVGIIDTDALIVSCQSANILEPA